MWNIILNIANKVRVILHHPKETVIFFLLSRGGSRILEGGSFGEEYGERGTRAYNGVLGALPQRGPGAESLLMGSAGFLSFAQPKERQIWHILADS